MSMPYWKYSAIKIRPEQPKNMRTNKLRILSMVSNPDESRATLGENASELNTATCERIVVAVKGVRMRGELC